MHPFIVGMRRSPDHGTGYSLIDLINQNPDFDGIIFDNDDVYYYEAKPAGRYSVLSPEHVENEAALYQWPSETSCPLIPKHIESYLSLDPWNENDFEWLVGNLLRLGKGFIARDNGDFVELPQCREFSIREIVGRHAFDEGGALLLSTDAYDQYIRRAIQNALAPLGLVPEIWSAGDHHNILVGFLGDDQNRVRNWQLFDEHADDIKIKLWIDGWSTSDERRKSFFTK